MTRRSSSILLVIAVVGAGLYALISPDKGRACGSFLAGMVLATAVFGVTTAAVDLFARESPSMGLAVATISYTTTVLLMAALLASASPRIIDGAALAVGLVLAVVVSLGAQFARAWVR